ALKLLYHAGCFIDVGEQTAGRFTVEASCWNECVVSLLAPRPSLWIKFNPIVPTLFRWKRREMNATWTRIERFTTSGSLFAGCVNTGVGVVSRHAVVLCRFDYSRSLSKNFVHCNLPAEQCWFSFGSVARAINRRILRITGTIDVHDSFAKYINVPND